MADIENQQGVGGGEAVAAEEDTMSGCLIMGCMACLGSATFAASWALRTFSLHAMTATSEAAQDLALAGVVAGVVGLVYGCSCCIIALNMCLRGNTEGSQQEVHPLVHAAVD